MRDPQRLGGAWRAVACRGGRTWWLVALLAPTAACGSCNDSGNHADGGEDGGSGGLEAGESDGGGSSGCEPDDNGSEEGGIPTDMMDHGRRLRRLTIALVDRFPSEEEYDALMGMDEDARDGWLRERAAELLTTPEFYTRMVEFGRRLIPMPLVPNYADEPEYGLAQAFYVAQCEAGTLHAGSWATDDEPCQDPDVVTRTDEPWWAEGTSVTILGNAAEAGAMVEQDDGQVIDCGERARSGYVSEAATNCGCGPHLVYCLPSTDLFNFNAFWPSNPVGQRRLMWEEPARLVAHLAWHDRPLSDLLVGDYSVGPALVQHAYVRHGRRTGAVQLDDFDGWWRASTWTAPADPEHAGTDPWAWSEFTFDTRNPYMLAARDTQFDPATDPKDALVGIPSAGVLTTLGMLAAHPRERVRAARMLEALACEVFTPPPGDVEFVPYQTDPATEGTCQHCHVRIDPAAIHFKRFQRAGGNRYRMLAIDNDRIPPEWITLEYPYGGDPWPRFARAFVPGTRLTPIDPQAAAADPDALFIDYLPPDQSLLGQVSDGTIGPLGFGKMVLASGAFDRCMVRRLHEMVVGRDVDPATEAGYLAELVEKFLAGERAIRPFVLALVETESFRRGF